MFYGHPAAPKWLEGEKKSGRSTWVTEGGARSEFSFYLSPDAPEALRSLPPPQSYGGGPATRPATAVAGIRRMAKPKGDIGY